MEEDFRSKQTIAQIFGVTTRRIEQLTAEGIIKAKGRPAKYDLLPTIQSYIRHLSDKANGREKRKTAQELEESKLQAEARLKTAKAEMAEKELNVLNGELHRAEDVEAVMTDHVMLIRAMILALPGRLAVDVAEKSPSEAAEVIKRECYKMLSQLSKYKYDKEEYQRRAAENRGWDEMIQDDQS